jgi:hypothetical protein
MWEAASAGITGAPYLASEMWETANAGITGAPHLASEMWETANAAPQATGADGTGEIESFWTAWKREGRTSTPVLINGNSEA